MSKIGLFVLGATFGISAVREIAAGGDFFLEVLGYLPLLADEEIGVFGADIDPDGRLTLLAELKAGVAWRNGVSVAFRLRRMGFDQSPVADSLIGPVCQPASTMTRVGVQVEYRF